MSVLTELVLLDLSATDILTGLISDFETETGEKLYPADPRRLLFAFQADKMARQVERYNAAWRQNFAATATGDNLDAIGELTDTPRNVDAESITTLEYVLSAPQAFDVIVSAGYRATDGQYQWATNEELVIPAGQTTGSVGATCTEAGADSNGRVPGQINKMIDLVPYVASVENTTTTSGGLDVEVDDDYRENVRLGPERLAVAGPIEAYRALALGAHPDIVSAEPYSPTPGTVEIRVWTGTPVMGSDVLGAVEDACKAEDVRPLTDLVNVMQADVVDYQTVLTYYIDGSLDAATALQIRTAVEAAVVEYEAWQAEKLGRDLNPDKLRSLVLSAGAKRLSITTPTYTVLTKAQVAYPDAPSSITYGGLEDE